MYKYILIDLDNTLINFDESVEISLKTIFDNVGVNMEYTAFKNIYKEINSKLWKDVERGILEKSKVSSMRFDKLLNSCLDLNVDPIHYSNMYLDSLKQSVILYDDTISTLEYLIKKYKIIVVTNGIEEVQKNKIENSVLKKYFMGYVTSEKAGCAKPCQKIFDNALQFFNDVKKEEVIMIGDSYSADIEGAVNYGIDSVWITSESNKKEATYSVSRLLELKNIL